MNKKIPIYLTAGIILIAGIGISLFTINKTENNINNDKQTEKEREETLKDKGENQLLLPKEDMENISDKTKDDIEATNQNNINEKINIIKTDGLSEYPKEKSTQLESKWIQLAQVANHVEIVKEMDGLKQKYNFTKPYNYEVLNIYNDAVLFKNSLGLNISEKGKIIKSMRTPKMLMISTLLLQEEARRDVIYDINSLTPIFNGSVTVNDFIIYTDEIEEIEKDSRIKNIYNETDSIQAIYKGTVVIEGNALECIVSEDSVGTLTLHGYYPINNNSYHYKTVKFFTDFD